MHKRKAITIYDEDTSLTFIKPYSDEYKSVLFVIHEDAYGEMSGVLTPIDELRTRLNLSTEEFNELLNKL